MNHTSLVAAAIIVLSAVAGPVQANEAEDTIRKVFMQRFPDARIDHLAESPIAGIFEVGLGSQVFYVSGDGRYVFNGKLIDLETRRDLTEGYLSKVRMRTLAEFDESRMIIFEPKGETKHTITTFTDVDCGFCRKMHSEIDSYADLGIRVRYMLYPRAGVKSKSYEKAVSVWCAKDQRKELTFAKTGGVPDRRTCENPVTEHMSVARQLGLQGTPMTITETGEQIMGYMPAQDLFAQMEATRTQAFQ
ncbi:MAG: DsbC family protein [Gammaproteobacteria bacterium]|nr:DsbC family protein [Gammaproteobacteria bacterium]